MKNKAELTYNGKTITLPVLEGTEGPNVLNIQNVYKELGVFTYDPGFTSTASCNSKITFIDGDKGILRYRGYDINDLAKQCNFMEVSYLLLNGDLPNEQEKENFEKNIKRHSLVHDQIYNFFRGFRRDAHPMAVMVGLMGGLSSFYHDSLDIHDRDQREIASYRLIAKVATFAAMAYRYNKGFPFVYPKNSLDYASNFLHMMFSFPTEEYHVNPILAKAIDSIFILHADHEQNASTSTVRLAGSSMANPFACIASGIAALWGPAHGGANEAVLNMLYQIEDVSKVPEFIKKAKDKNDPFRLMGFGHRVYKNFDPRAAIVRNLAHEVLDTLGFKNAPLLKLAMELEKIALQDEYFIEKKLYPNVDFYSGIIFQAMGIPPSMFTVLFGVARTVGWVAQWREMIAEPGQKIGRPRQLYIGEKARIVKPFDKR